MFTYLGYLISLYTDIQIYIPIKYLDIAITMALNSPSRNSSFDIYILIVD
jgi:hypothetical protein